MPWGPALQCGSLGLVHVLSRTGRPCVAREAPVVSRWPFSLCALVAPRAVSSEALPPRGLLLARGSPGSRWVLAVACGAVT